MHRGRHGGRGFTAQRLSSIEKVKLYLFKISSSSHREFFQDFAGERIGMDLFLRMHHSSRPARRRGAEVAVFAVQPP